MKRSDKLMSYVDIKNLYKQGDALYCRVSTAGQSIQSQLLAAEIYFKKNNIVTENIKHFIDHNVSANKLSVIKRPAFQNLLIEIKKGRIKTLYVISRDRLARNFYEYVELVKTLYKYGVNIVFTDTAQPAFSNELSIEALYGMFPQHTGYNIASRNKLVHKQYPNSIWGFTVLNKGSEKRYIPDPNIANDLRTFFYDIVSVSSPENLFEKLIQHKKIFKDHYNQLSRLANPFYAGHILIQDEYVPLRHVEPIISLNDFLKIQEVLSNCQQELGSAMGKSSDTGFLVPICNICKSKMTFRSGKLKKNSYYVCAKKHPRIQIIVEVYNQLISDHLTDILHQLSIIEIKKDVCNFLKIEEIKHNNQMGLLINKLESTHREVTEKYGVASNNLLKKLGKKVQIIKEELNMTKTLLIMIEEAKKEINSFASIVKDSLENGILNYQIEHLIPILFSKIEVSSDAIIYHVTFGRYLEEKDDSYAS